MKNKPGSHKSSNTFKFQTFSERIANINIDVIHRIERRSDVPDSTDTFFDEALRKWSELNCSKHFDDFKQELGNDVMTLNQLILNEQQIIECLQKHLQIENNLALQPLLELVVALARDLQSDFYNHFPKFFEIIANLLNTKDPDQIEWSFTCLSYLFKFLWRHMIKEIQTVFLLYLPLLSDKNPVHIRNFAAESFAFLIRKTTDKNKLLDFIFLQLDKDAKYAIGIGQLLFEAIKGFQKQLHFCSEKILPLLLEKLGNGLQNSNCSSKLPWEKVLEAEIQMVSSVLTHIDKKYSEPLWNSLDIILKQLLSVWKKNDDDEKRNAIELHIHHVLCIIEILITFQNGIFIIKPYNRIYELFESTLKIGKLSDDCGSLLFHIISKFLLNLPIDFHMAEVNKLVQLVFDSEYSPSLIFKFVCNLFTYGMFGKDVLPPLLKLCQKLIYNENNDWTTEILTILGKVVNHFSPFPQTGQDAIVWKRYRLDFFDLNRSKSGHDVKAILKVFFMKQSKSCILENLSSIWASVLLLPHVSPIEISKVILRLQDLLKILSSLVKDRNLDQEKLQFVLYYVLVTLMILDESDQTFKIINSEFVLEFLRICPCDISVLRMVDVIMTFATKFNISEFISEAFFSSLYPLVESNLSSPYHEVRLLTLRILASCQDESESGVIQISLAAEKISANVATYREKLRLLQKLDNTATQAIFPIGHSLSQFPLRFLLGALYENFQLVWNPILTLIETHARGLSIKSFWEIFMPHLHEVILIIGKSNENHIANSINIKNCIEENSELEKFFLTCSLPLSENPDHENHRLLLWKVMEQFADLAEPRSRDICPLFLQFLKQEYYPNDTVSAPTQDITSKYLNEIKGTDKSLLSFDDQIKKTEKEDDSNELTIAELSDDDNDIDDDNDDDENIAEISQNTHLAVDSHEHSQFEFESGEEIIQNRKLQTKKKLKPKFKSQKQASRKKGLTKLLCVHLKVFAKFRNPRALYREPELKEVFHNLLTHPYSEVQKLVLDCIMNYNDKTLIQYKENLYNMLEDKTFKSELTSFNIDVQSRVIKDEDRKTVLPVLMRILYGKMLHKTGRKASGRNNANFRRSLILRFLAGSQETELFIFFSLAFKPFESLIQDDVLKTVLDIKDTIDTKSVVPLKRIQGSLSLMNIIFSKLGNLMNEYLPWFLKLLLSITTVVAALLEKRDNIALRFLNPLKDLRTSAISRIIQFFEIFSTYPFTTEEIEAIFEAAVWPQLLRIHFESLYSPSVLLQLFHQWSTNPRYFGLFTKHFENDTSVSPLPQILKLFTADKVRSSVVNVILELLENLLTFADFDGSDGMYDNEGEIPKREVTFLIIRNCLPPPKICTTDNVELPNFGTLILLPHVPQILEQLKKLIKKYSKSSKKFIPEKILNILIRLSEFVTDADVSFEVIELMFPFLQHQSHLSEVTGVHILKIISNLIKYSSKVENFIRNVAELFGTLSSRNSRAALCEVLMGIAARNNDYQNSANIIEKLNAWDVRHVDQPDYISRLDAFLAASNYLKNSPSIDLHFTLLVTFNCTYYISTSDDMSLRDSSSKFLQDLAERLNSLLEVQPDVVDSLLYIAILPEIKKGLRSKNENARREFIIVLAKVVKSCPSLPKLNDLHQLTDSDHEKDFFENIIHIQLHRRANAMRRLAKDTKLENFHESVLMHYIMPIATSFLFTDAYIKHPNIIEAAVELIGSVCHALPWSRYDGILKYYLGLLSKLKEYQKTAVKVVVAILDSFHFDLSEVSNIHGALVAPPEKAVVKTSDENEVPEEQMEIDELTELTDEIEAKAELIQKATLTKADATKIYHNITKGILPKLHRCLTKKTKSESEHKLLRQNFPEDEEVLRIPIALAMVKLLQHLPKGLLERNITGLFLKICMFLKSRAESIREATRETLVKIMISLGPSYFPHLLKQMRQTMTKGYQVHVMIFTLHVILTNLNSQLQIGDLDTCFLSLIEICNEELFGQVSEEKEVAQITGKLKEARGNKSFNMYEIMARFITIENCLVPLLMPLKQILATSHKHQVVNKSQECFHSIALGLIENNSLLLKSKISKARLHNQSTEHLEYVLIIINGIIKEKIPELSAKKKNTEEKTIPPHLQRSDSYLLAPEPIRNGKNVKTSTKTNAHILIHFGLELLYFILKTESVLLSEPKIMGKVDPFVPHLIECLNSRHVKLISTSLRCLVRMFRRPLPSINDNINRIGSSIFTLLSKYSGSSQGENSEMVLMCFKAVTALIREIKYHTITEEQLQVLLIYAEQDILDHSRQESAFALLKEILNRKLVAKELHELMKKIAEMSISSDLDRIRVQSREVFRQYLLDYPVGKALQSHFEFYLNQLSFEHEYGRKSALEMLESIIKTFPIEHIRKSSEKFFIALALCLVNDSSVDCHKQAAQCIKSLLSKLPPRNQDVLFSAVMSWLSDSLLRHRRLAAQLCGLFAEVLELDFRRYLDKLLPLISQQLEAGKFSGITYEAVERTADHLVYYTILSLMKIIKGCQLIKNSSYTSEMNNLWEKIQYHLLHPHTWVRLAACQMFGLLFAAYSIQDLLSSSSNNENDEFLLADTYKKVDSLAKDFVSQLQAPEIELELADQIVKNLVYIGKIFWHCQKGQEIENQTEKNEVNNNGISSGTASIPSIDWLIKKMNREAKFEVANNPKEIIKRSSILKWLAAISLELGVEGLSPLRLRTILIPIHRELSDNSPQASKDLKNLANEIADLLKKVVGIEKFSKEYATLQIKISEKRSERKNQKAQLAISNPEKAAKKRIKKQSAKREAKKRRIEKLRTTKPRKKRLKDLAISVM